MSPRSWDDRPIHLTKWGVERIMTRAEAIECAAGTSSVHKPPVNDDDWLGLTHLATALHVVGDSGRARVIAARAAKLNPNALTLLNLAVILEAYGEFDKSLALAEQGVKCDPTSQFVGLLYAQGLLRQGRWDEGWGPFCWYCWGRIWAEMEQYIREWRGEPLEGKRLLVMQGGGFGDNLMFFRWIGEAKKLGAHITYACPEAMLELLHNHPWVDRLIPTHEGPETDMLPEFDCTPSDYDFFIPIMGMPKVLRTTVETIPGLEPYIFPQLLKPRPHVLRDKLTVGVVWKAGEVLDPRRHRTLNDEQARRLLSVDSVQWVNLQLGEEPPVKTLRPNILGWVNTARAIADLDLVVCVDTGLTHLAGAMGKPTWVIIPGLSDWKWLLNRDDSAFYPSIRIFRNKGLGMDNALDAVIEELGKI